MSWIYTWKEDEQIVFIVFTCVIHTNVLPIKCLQMCQVPYGPYGKRKQGKAYFVHVNPAHMAQDFLVNAKQITWEKAQKTVVVLINSV